MIFYARDGGREINIEGVDIPGKQLHVPGINSAIIPLKNSKMLLKSLRTRLVVTRTLHLRARSLKMHQMSQPLSRLTSHLPHKQQQLKFLLLLKRLLILPLLLLSTKHLPLSCQIQWLDMLQIVHKMQGLDSES